MESEAVAELILACIIFLDNQRVSIRMVNDATRHHLAIVLLRTFVQNHIHGVNNILKGRSKSMFCLVSRTHVSSLNLKKKKKKKGYIISMASLLTLLHARTLMAKSLTQATSMHDSGWITLLIHVPASFAMAIRRLVQRMMVSRSFFSGCRAFPQQLTVCY